MTADSAERSADGGPEASAEAEYRVDDLARAAGTTVRNVRVYQDRGLLPPPRRAGRVGIYSEAHLARLRLIGQLLERGYAFAQIAELVSAWEQGRDLADVLGLEQALTDPWSDELPSYLSAEDLLRLLGDREAVALLAERGFVEPEGDRYRVPSPRLLNAGAQLIAAGIPLETVVDLADRLQNDIDQGVRRLVEAIAEHIFAAHEPGWLPTGKQVPALAELIRRLRPLGRMAVDAMLAQSLERQVREVLGDRLMSALEAPPAPRRRRRGKTS